MRLFFTHVGTGDPVIILHGLFGSQNNWRTIARRLGEEYSVFTPDLRNHGQSPHHPIHSYASMADDVRALMDEEGLHQPFLIGHSMGGKTAMELALGTPERVKGLVVVDIAPTSSSMDVDGYLDALLSMDLSLFVSRQEVDREMVKRIPDERTRQFLLTNITRSADGKLVWRINLKALADNRAQIFAGLSGGRHYAGRTLFVRGEHSRYLHPQDEEQIRALFPNATIQTINGAGHWIHADAPEAFLAQVRSFLRDSRLQPSDIPPQKVGMR
jgi:esterase